MGSEYAFEVELIGFVSVLHGWACVYVHMLMHTHVRACTLRDEHS